VLTVIRSKAKIYNRYKMWLIKAQSPSELTYSKKKNHIKYLKHLNIN